MESLEASHHLIFSCLFYFQLIAFKPSDTETLKKKNPFTLTFSGELKSKGECTYWEHSIHEHTICNCRKTKQQKKYSKNIAKNHSEKSIQMVWWPNERHFSNHKRSMQLNSHIKQRENNQQQENRIISSACEVHKFTIRMCSSVFECGKAATP